ncbi:MAG: acetyl-CoA C-acyltransferase [Planctomycetia bacterium]|nr:acetyl-CoA C-acyltransferase [Planctomycetia bacterium]
MGRDQTVIVAGVRTPIGALGGTLASVPAPRLGATCTKALLSRVGIRGEEVGEVIMGNVVSAGLGQNPARQAALFAGLPPSVGATTVNKVCGSGLKAVMLADQAIRLGDAGLIVAGGMESMSRAPYLLTKAREGYRMGNAELVDAMIHDGLWDIYGGQSMGTYGDRCAARYGFTRREQDDFAVRSHTRARRAIEAGVFAGEIVPVEIDARGKESVVSADEGPGRFDEPKLRALKPAFHPDGTVTAGNASSINDGAAALLVASPARCEGLGLRPLARVVGAATFSQEPEWFSTAPIGAIRSLLDRIGWSVSGVDLFEINEAFAAVTMAAERDLSLPAEKVNIYGGAVALGHPIGCSGARLLVTLLTALTRTGGRRGVASLCIGGGEAVALAVEIPG